jgi:hypothetical protein
MYYAEFAGSESGFVLDSVILDKGVLVSAHVVNGNWWLKKNSDGFWCAHNDLASEPVSVTMYRDLVFQKIPDAMAKSHYDEIIYTMRGKMAHLKVYPETVMPADVVNSCFGTGLFRIKGGRALYDQVTMQDGGKAVYLARLTSTAEGLQVYERWIPWDTVLEQMYEVA